MHRNGHRPVQLQFAGHECGCGIHAAVQDCLECFAAGGQGNFGLFIAGANAIFVDHDGAFAFDHEFRGRTEAINFLAQFLDCGVHNIAHFIPLIVV